MTRTKAPLDMTTITGRAFARSAASGVIDGHGERGIYADDLRLIRRVEAFRAGPMGSVPGRAAIGEHGAAVRFELQGVAPGEGVLLLVELDGTDVFTAREIQLDRRGRPEATLGLGAARPRARVEIDAICSGAGLAAADGVALAAGNVDADGSTRTASWRWTVPEDAPAPVDVVIEFRATWALTTDSATGALTSFEDLDARWREWIGGWIVERPFLDSNELLAVVYERSLEDLAALRLPEADGSVFAAGLPWAATVVGRDALLSAWMALPVDPDIAEATLLHLARHQATTYDLPTDAAPGKVQHDERHGAAAERWHARYYGTVDATPLFVMLLAETCAWAGTPRLALLLEANARAALGWLEARIDEDDLGLVSFLRRAERGLDIQSWKDTGDSQQDRTGGAASGLIRPIEAQAYAIAAFRGAAQLARTAWMDDEAARRWEARAETLAAQLLDRYLVAMPASQVSTPGDPRVPEYFAHAVDASGLPLDASCSNIGHVLWADALGDDPHVHRIVDQLVHPSLSSGWGIRTLSTLDAGFDATCVHRGAVWPHDTAICAAGIARVDPDAAARTFLAMLEAGGANGGRLSEPLTGVPRRSTDVMPVQLTGGNDPLAVSAGAVLLLLRSLLGLRPSADGTTLESTTERAPKWMVNLRWRGVRAVGGRWDVVVGNDLTVTVRPG
ncbi:MAG: amylo-alpha,6-glucosidase [Thermoleophilia bacterium]|jgi:glycogen debranching enzyme|nr:amylo-alpha,6-glucosidase [Thermoleophilia bacterium]